MPSAIDEVKVVAFYPAEQDASMGLVLELSSDGKTFQAAEAVKRLRLLPGPPAGPARGRKSTMAEYQMKPPAHSRCLRIGWQGEAELDRIEIYHAGEP